MPRSKVAFIFSHDKSPLVFGGGDYMGTINLSIKMRSIKNAWKIISAFQMCNLGIGKRGPSQIKSFLELTTRGLGIFFGYGSKAKALEREAHLKSKAFWNSRLEALESFQL
jgi:hypothetical protein